MAIKLEKSVTIPNSVYCPQIILSTSITDGRLVTSANIHLQPAAVDEKGQWVRTGFEGEVIHIPNLAKMDDDLKSLGPQVEQLYGQIISLIESINKTRKVL